MNGPCIGNRANKIHGSPLSANRTYVIIPWFRNHKKQESLWFANPTAAKVKYGKTSKRNSCYGQRGLYQSMEMREFVTSPIDLTFSVDRSSTNDLSSQIVCGLRRAILSGRYPAGSRLPTLSSLSVCLGVSMNTVRAAYGQLSEEGLIVSRTGVGSMVLPLGRRGRRGQILLVFPESKSSYVTSEMSCFLRNVFMEQGYFVNEVVVPFDANGRHRLEMLTLQLSEPIDLAIQIHRTPAIRRALIDSGVPFIAFDLDPAGRIKAGNCVCHICAHLDGGADEMIAQCRATNVKSVFLACAWSQCLNLVRLFNEAGITVVSRQFCTSVHYGRQEEVRRAGMEAIFRIVADEPHLLSGLLVFPDDDIFASGGLMALACSGLCVPEDVKVVTLSNKGAGPVYPKSLARLEIDPSRFAACIVQSAKAFLSHAPLSRRLDVESVYIKGDSFPCAV